MEQTGLFFKEKGAWKPWVYVAFVGVFVLFVVVEVIDSSKTSKSK
jgi:hypothetical protein